MTLCSIIRKGVLTYILPSLYYTASWVDLSSTSLQKVSSEVSGFSEAPPCRSSLLPPQPCLSRQKSHLCLRCFPSSFPIWPKNISKGLKKKHLCSQKWKASCPSNLKSSPYLNSLCHLYSSHHLVFSPQDLRLILYLTPAPFESGLVECNVGDCCL